MKKVLVIIPTYNEAANIDQVVAAIEHVAVQKRRSHAFSLLIVDSNSPDGTADHVNTLQKSTVIYIF